MIDATKRDRLDRPTAVTIEATVAEVYVHVKLMWHMCHVSHLANFQKKKVLDYANLDMTNQRSMRKRGLFTSLGLASRISPDLIQVDPFALQFPQTKRFLSNLIMSSSQFMAQRIRPLFSNISPFSELSPAQQQPY